MRDPDKRRAAKRRYYTRHREKILEYAEAYRSQMSEEQKKRHRAQSREWTKRNPHRYAELTKRWAKENAGKIREIRQRWREANPEAYALAKARASIALCLGVRPSDIPRKLAEAKASQVRVRAALAPGLSGRFSHAEYMRQWRAAKKAKEQGT